MCNEMKSEKSLPIRIHSKVLQYITVKATQPVQTATHLISCHTPAPSPHLGVSCSAGLLWYGIEHVIYEFPCSGL